MPVFHCLFCSNEDLVYSCTSNQFLVSRYFDDQLLETLLPFQPLSVEVSHRLDSLIHNRYNPMRAPKFVGFRDSVKMHLERTEASKRSNHPLTPVKRP